MHTQGHLDPWAIRLVTDRLPHSPPPYAGVKLDAETQVACYYDRNGNIIEMGKHGTDRTRGTATMSNTKGGDGPGPQQETQDDNTTDYESD